MNKLFVLLLCLPACTADVFASPDDASSAEPDAAAWSAPPPTRFERLAPDAGKAPDVADAGASDACVLSDHWNGYAPFQSCEISYSEKLALEACASYFGTGCALLSDAGCGPRVVGAKSVAWILWDWPDEAGVGRAHESSFEACPGAPSDPAWW